MASDLHSAYVIKRAKIAVTGDYTIAAVTGKSIIVTSLVISSSVDEALTVEDGGTAIGDIHPVGANQSMVFPYNSDGWWASAVGATLAISPATGTTVLAGSITYAEV